jgi:hypothetical protein
MTVHGRHLIASRANAGAARQMSFAHVETPWSSERSVGRLAIKSRMPRQGPDDRIFVA